MSTYDISTKGGRRIGWSVPGDQVDVLAAEHGADAQIAVHDDEADQRRACKRCCSTDTQLTAKGVCADYLSCAQIQPTLDTAAEVA
jgi:hypothetical protein